MANSEGVEWRPAVGWEGRYEVSDTGRVRSVTYVTRNNRPVAANERAVYRQKSGHIAVGLSLDGVQKTVRVHRLVAEAFITNDDPEGKPHVLHWDDDKENNHVSNLRWGNPSDNMRDKVRNGRDHNTRKTHCPKGHPYFGDNLVINSRGSRECRACQVEARARFLAKKHNYAHGDANKYRTEGCRCALCTGAYSWQQFQLRNPGKTRQDWEGATHGRYPLTTGWASRVD